MTSGGEATRRVLVTGASGYIGRHVAARFAAAGWSVAAIVRTESGATPAGVVRHVYDGTIASLNAALAAARPDLVVHLASAVVVQHDGDGIDTIVEANIRFPTLLLEAMRTQGVRRLIDTGTSWQHFGPGDAYEPANLYAASKQAFSDLAAYYVSAHGLSLTTLKLFDVYGPHDERRKLLPLLLGLSRSTTPLAMSPGEQSVDLVHIDDVAAAYLAAAAGSLSGPDGVSEDFTVRSGRAIDLRSLVALLETIAGRPVPVIWGGRPYRDREVMGPWRADKPPPNWTPEISLETGLTQVVALSDATQSQQEP